MAERVIGTVPAEAEALRRATEAEAEVASLRAVAVKIMATADLEASLSSVTHEALAALDADIAGVFLREGDQMAMRGCVGNRSRDTARLRMGRNEGLAGLVFATGEPARVDFYVDSDLISAHFHDLARVEGVRSALGAPLTLAGEVIGVLEVWRRRESVFTPEETGRLVALADLGAIALNNARLHDAARASLQEAEAARRETAENLDRVEHALRTQQDLIASILGGGGLAGSLRIAARAAEASAVYLDRDLEVVAAYPADTDAGCVRELIPVNAAAGAVVHSAGGERPVVIAPVAAGADRLGWVALIGSPGSRPETLDWAASQAGLACSLNSLEEQAAARARAGAQEDLVQGLLWGGAEERRAAAARARSLQVDLRGELRVLLCDLGGLGAKAGAEGWELGQLEDFRRRVVQQVRGGLSARAVLVAAHRDGLVVLYRAPSAAATREALTRLSASLRASYPELRPTWGVSGVHSATGNLANARSEAETAAAVPRQATDRVVVCYEDLGVLRLMLADPRDADVRAFVEEVLGPIRAHDDAHRGALLKTLRAYVEAGCSQQDAAARLFVHVKTIKYRLTQIERLSGLNLAEHRDRVRVDIALNAADLIGI